MITKTSYSKDLMGTKDSSGEYVGGVNTAYWGISALQAAINHEEIRSDMVKHLYKDCVADGYQGIIVGLEDNNQFFDYYYIVYVPELGKVVYKLCNDSEFANSIKL